MSKRDTENPKVSSSEGVRGPSEVSFPQSVEEAAALLGATITTLAGKSNLSLRTVEPPQGMHRVFGTVKDLPGSQLLTRLFYLRALLRSVEKEQIVSKTPLLSSPSILAVLMKLLTISNTMGQESQQFSSSQSFGNAGTETSAAQRQGPPLLSTPLRGLWVDCVVLCHAVAVGTGSGKQNGVDTVQFLRKLLDLVGLNPRSRKAAGGVRVAALQVIGKLMDHTKLQSTLIPWANEVLPVCLRSIKSSGQYHPTLRVMALHTAQATVGGARRLGMQRMKMAQEIGGGDEKNSVFLLTTTTLEEKALQECIRIIKQASQDKFPEVRVAAATLGGMLAPMLVITSGPSSTSDPTVLLEEVLQCCSRNLDDNSPATSMEWADAMSRCLCAALAWRSLSSKDVGRVRMRAGSLVPECSSLINLLRFLKTTISKAGGEQAAARMGGTYSTGGRAVRLGWGLVMGQLLRLQVLSGAIGQSTSTTTLSQVTHAILDICGSAGEQREVGAVFGPGRGLITSKSDHGVARMLCNRVLRRVMEVAPEGTQLSYLSDLVNLLSQISGSSQETSSVAEEGGGQALKMNPNQIQVIIIEISHLLATLGDAAASQIPVLRESLEPLLDHESHGVRHEAAMSCASITACFPEHGREMILASIDVIQVHFAQLVAFASSAEANSPSPPRRGFLKKKEVSVTDSSAPHQCAIHGRSLMVSTLVRDLPGLPGGLPSSILSTVLSAAEILLACQNQTSMLKANAMAACNCVKGGFQIISGVLATGPKGATAHMPMIFESWKKASNLPTSEHMEPRHELTCVEALLASVVVFLKFCPELLLTIPQALTQVTGLLELLLPQLLPGGRLVTSSATPQIHAKRDCCRASLLEAFAWLPSGSFPMVADTVFSFASNHIRSSVDTDVSCSLLYSLVNREDAILDSKTLCRAHRDGQIGGAKDMEEHILLLTGEVASHSEREAVLLLLGREPSRGNTVFRGSRTLALYAYDNDDETPPTPLHGIGTWRRPINPSSATQVRLIDAAIQAFSATFGLKGGSEQQAAMEMLESLVPPLLAQLARTIGVNAALSEQSPRSKSKEDNSAVVNITAVLLSCLKALPLHEASHNVPVGLGPPWMTKAKDLLLTLLPSASSFVRRAAAEGLSLLATLGVTEDAHFLQSTVLHSLDEVMQGNKPDGKPRTIALEPISAARAGSLLTLACIQRTADNVSKRQLARARSRVTRNFSVTNVGDTDELPILQMMTRILPSMACFGFRDYFVVRTYAIHSFEVLLVYSGRLDKPQLDSVDIQLLRKGVELIEENFTAAWMMASAELDKGQEVEKMSTEVAFLSSLLRFMSFLAPCLHHLKDEDSDIAQRFVLMARVVLEHYGSHPAVNVEAMAFFEVIVSHRNLLPQPWKNVNYTESPVFAVVPSVMSALEPLPPDLLKAGEWDSSCLPSSMNMRAVSSALGALFASKASIGEWSDFESTSVLFASLNSYYSSRYFTGCAKLRSLATPRSAELEMVEFNDVESDLIQTARAGVRLDMSSPQSGNVTYLRWVLFARALLVNSSSDSSRMDSDTDVHDGVMTLQRVLDLVRKRENTDFMLAVRPSGTARWQVKTLAAQLAGVALATVKNIETEIVFRLAKEGCEAECRKATTGEVPIPESRAAFHVRELVTSACMSTSATLDNSELFLVQLSSMFFLEEVIKTFAKCPDPEISGSLLLDQYCQQILSSIKHGLTVASESGCTKSFRVFTSACACLVTAIQLNLASEPTVLKRLLRAVVPKPEEVCPFPSSSKPTLEDGKGKGVMSLVSQILCCSKLILGQTSISKELEEVADDLLPERSGIAIYASACAIDGARLLMHFDLSLSGGNLGTSKDDEDRLLSPAFSGYLFDNPIDLDSDIQMILATEWSSFAGAAIRPLFDSIQDQPDSHCRSMCSEWLRSLVPIILEGVRHCLHKETLQASQPEWVSKLKSDDILANCLEGICSIVERDNSKLQILESCGDTFDTVVGELVDELWKPYLTMHKNGEFSTKVCLSLCHLIRVMSRSDAYVGDKKLLVIALQPLVFVQENGCHRMDPTLDEIVSTCMDSLGAIVRSKKASESIASALVVMLVDLLAEDKVSPSILSSSKDLLSSCFGSSYISDGQRQQILVELAAAEVWDVWLEILTVQHAEPSIDAARKTLDHSGSFLGKLCMFLQQTQNKDLVTYLFNKLGGHVVGLLFKYGTMTVEASARDRQRVCGESTKVALAAYQTLAATGDNGLIGNFLDVIFEVLIAVLRYNGVPNHPLPQHNSDPALGRLMAQTILHTARTTPIAFKDTVARLSDQDRPLLEFAVRAEMNGYAVQTVKKKINLKGFKK